MIITDMVRCTNNNKIAIPYFHRPQVSLMSTSKYTLAFFINKHPQNEFEMPQLVITPIPFSEWPYIWKVRVALNERRGLLRDIVQILQENKLNVLVEESHPVDLERYHVIQLIVSAGFYKSGHSDKRDEEIEISNRLRLVKETILVNFLDEIHFGDYGLNHDLEPSIRIQRIVRYATLYNLYHGLYTTDKDRREHRNSEMGFITLPSRTGLYLEFTDADDNKMLPIFVDLKKSNGYAVNEKTGEGESMNYIIHSDAPNQLMSIYFPQKARELYIARITHNDEIGAIAEFSKALADRNINLFSSLTRKEKNDKNHFEFVYEIQSKPKLISDNPSQKPSDCSKTVRDASNDLAVIYEALNQPHTLVYKPILSRPVTYDKWTNWVEYPDQQSKNSNNTKDDKTKTKNAQKKSENPDSDKISPENEPVEEPTNNERQTSSFEDWIKNSRQKISDIIVKLEADLRGTNGIIDRSKDKEIRARLRIARELSLTSTFARPKIFVSYRFDKRGETTVHFLRKVFEEYGFEVVVAKDLKNQYITEGIYGSIIECHFWIGVLTQNIHNEGDKIPSQWIQWEYGIARGCTSILECLLMADYDVQLDKNLTFREVPRFQAHDIRYFQDDVAKIAHNFAIAFTDIWKARFNDDL